MTHPITVLDSTDRVRQYYTDLLSDFLQEIYYLPRIIVTAESGAGKSTLISRLSTNDMRDFLAMEIGQIRTTACTAQHVFDPNLPKEVLAICAKMKHFGEIRDKITVIAISALASYLVDYSKEKDDFSIDDIVHALYEYIFIKNKSLYNLNEIVSIRETEVIKKDLQVIFTELVARDYVSKARAEKARHKDKAKNLVIKKFVEDEIANNLGSDSEDVINCAFDNIFNIIENSINKIVDKNFEGKNGEYYYSIFNIVEDAIKANTLMGTLFGITDGSKNKTNKGIQFFLQDLVVHIPTNEVFSGNKAFVIIDTQGLNHDGDEKGHIVSSFLTLINYNRVNQVLFLSPFSTDDSVFNIVGSELNKVKKRLRVTAILSKYDSYINNAIVARGKDTDDLEEDELREFVKENIVPPANKAVSEIKEFITQHNAAKPLASFDDNVYTLAFNRNYSGHRTTVKDLYDIITKILINIEKDTETVHVKVKRGVTDNDIDSLIPISINKQVLYDLCVEMINTNSFIKSLQGLANKEPHWKSVYALKDEVSRGNGHTTRATIYDNFSIYPANGVKKSLEKSPLLNSVSWDLSNLEDLPDDLVDVLKKNIQSELDNNVKQLISMMLTFNNITSFFYTSLYYLSWYKGLIELYRNNLADPEYWVDTIHKQLLRLVKVKTRETISPVYVN